MQKKYNVWAIFAIVMTFFAVGIVYHDLLETPQEIIPEGYLSGSEIQNLVMSEVNKVNSEKDSVIADLTNQLAKKVVEVTEEIKESVGYLIDKLFLSDGFNQTIYSDREIKTLFDGKISFDGDGYDAEETIVLKDIELLANENDFEGKVYMTIPEGAVEYKLTFEDDLNTSLIDSDETLSFNFLGENYEVSEWDNTTITLNKGTEQKVIVGESITIDGKVVNLDAIADDKIFICVDDVCKSIEEDKSKVVNGIEISVNSVFNSETYQFAYLTLGEEVELTIESGDEYEEDSEWEYVISANSIGIVLVEDHTEIDLDGDEEFQAVGVDEMFCLPNEYVCIQFNGMSDEDTEEYNLRLDEKSGVDYVRIDGDFQKATKDYDRIYVNTTGIYDRDLVLIDNATIELGDTDSILNISGGLIFEDFEVNFDLNVSNVGTDKSDYLTDYGLIVINPKDSAEDNEFNIFVPENKVEGSLNLI